MTDRYYGVDPGGMMPNNVTESATTTGKSVELHVVTSDPLLTKTQLLNALEAIENRIVVDNWPPA